MGHGEFSPGRRVSDVERTKQFEKRRTWLQESQRLGYGDQREESTEGIQMPFRDETADAPVTTRRRSRSDYDAKVFEESGQEKMNRMSLSVHCCRIYSNLYKLMIFTNVLKGFLMIRDLLCILFSAIGKL